MAAGFIQQVTKTTTSKNPTRKMIKKRVKKVKVSKTLKSAIKKVISEQTESKQAFMTSGNTLVKFNSGIDAVGDLIQVLPNISVGTAENNRIGNQIRAQNLNIRGYIKLDLNEVPDSTKLPNVMVRMLVVSMKTAGSFTDAQAQSPKIGTLLKKGGTTSTFSGLLQDLYAPINTDVFTVHYDKRFNLSQSYINSQGVTPPSTYFSQDISKTVKFFNINVRCKNRLLKFDEDVGSDIQPSNFAPFLLLGYSYLDGSAADVLDTKVGLCYDSTFIYEDA